MMRYIVVKRKELMNMGKSQVSMVEQGSGTYGP